jgi:hypothetical protein
MQTRYLKSLESSRWQGANFCFLVVSSRPKSDIHSFTLNVGWDSMSCH